MSVVPAVVVDIGVADCDALMPPESVRAVDADEESCTAAFAMTPFPIVFEFRPNRTQTIFPEEGWHCSDFPAAVAAGPAANVIAATAPGV